MSDQGLSDSELIKRDVPSFIEPRPPLILNPFMRPKPQKGTNLMELFEESDLEEPDWVQVYLRLKPCHVPSGLYEVKNDRCLITSMDTATAGHGRRTQHNVSKMYTFSQIFGPESTQKEIFEQVVKGNLKKLPEGHNFTLLTYGASGSGKTYTLMGTVTSPGLVPRSLEYVFGIVDAAQQPLYKPSEEGAEKLQYSEQEYELQWVRRLRHVSAPLRDKYRRMSAQLRQDMNSMLDLSNRTRYYVWVSFVEIYNEAIYDLLVNSDRSKATSKLRLREDTSGNVYVKGATQAFVRSGGEAYDVMAAGKHNLQVAATGVHAQSSRSHCIFTITLLTETDDGVRTSYVRLCDLAGSERAHATRNTGARMAESRAINASLHVLERCLHTLRRKQKREDATLVPYRESKLTRLLGAGLSGCRGEAVSMVVTVNPAAQYVSETRHVLQLAAVARDIQINQTVAETESTFDSYQNTTVEVNAEIMKLRADNERLHFELLQAQTLNKELMASMAEQRQEAATTMAELVQQAQTISKTYYEAQLSLLRTEMEDMREDYESRLKVMESVAGLPVEDNTGTPSRALQRKVAHLMGVIAVLEEKLSAAKLASQRAEDELQHLRACIEERDEKANEYSAEEEIMDSDSDDESSDHDSCNESLEPTFKKEDINRSRLLRKSLGSSATEKYVSLKQLGIKNVDESIRYIDDCDAGEIGHDNDTRHENEDDSVLELSTNTIKDDDDHDDTVRESIEIDDDHNATVTKESIEMTEQSHNKSKEVTCSGDDNNSGKLHDVNDSTYMTGESNGSEKFEETPSNENYDENDENTRVKNDSCIDIITETQDKTVSTDIANTGDKSEYSNVKNKVIKNSLPRGTYFVRESEAFDKSKLDKSEESSKFSCRETYFVKDKGDLNDVSDYEDENYSNKSSLTRGTYFVKESETSLSKGTCFFKKPETDLNKSKDAQKSNSILRGMYFVKDKGAIDDIVNNSHKSDVEHDKSWKNKHFDTDVQGKRDIIPERLVNKLLYAKRQNHASDVSLAQFELLEKAASNKSPEKKISDAFSNIKISNEKHYFDDNLQKNNDDSTDLVKIKIMSEKKAYFDDHGERSAETVNSNNFSYERSPSIVKDDVTEDFEPSTMKKLLGESFSRPDILPIHKVTVPKKHDSIDIFEGFDSPGLVKSKIDTLTSNDKPQVINAPLYKFNTNESHENTTGNNPNLRIKFDKNVKEDKEKQTNESSEAKIDYSNVIIKQENIDFDFVRPNEKQRPVSILDTCIEKAGDSKTNASSIIVENTRKCIDDIVHNQKEKEIKSKAKRISITEKLEDDGVINSNVTDQSQTNENTIDEFEKIVKNVSPNSSTAFELLVSQESEKEHGKIKTRRTDKLNAESKTKEFEKVKYNLRHKHNTSDERKEEFEVNLQQSKTEKKPRRNLRLRRGKTDNNEQELSDKDLTKEVVDKNTMLKDIVNLQNEFSDVTLDVPAQKKDVKDISSPEKGQEENLPPHLGIQSCPSKSVTRSRRKLFTPLAEPLEESFPSGGSGERERVRVPRPSYHRPRARRRL